MILGLVFAKNIIFININTLLTEVIEAKYKVKVSKTKNDFNDVTVEIYNKNKLIAELNVNDLDFKAVKDLVKKIER